jgi:D-sedoheptulose 7-phosphate isomerase
MSPVLPSLVPTINTYLLETADLLSRIQVSAIEENISLLYKAWKQGRKVFIIGNGGSASTASHMANDLSKGAIVPEKPRVKAIALTDNISLISAWANDTSYENIFKEQLENLLGESDVVIGISASGNSPNILRAIEFAKRQGAVTIGWTGGSGGRLKDLADLAVLVPSDDVGMIEGCHMVLDHLVTSELRKLILEDRIDRTVGN